MNAHDEAGRALLCQCLISVSMADGELDGREIATIVTIVEQVTGDSISADDVVAATIELGDWEDFRGSLSVLAEPLDSGFRLQILKACILVGRADTLMIDAEIEQIYGVAEALGFNRMETDEQFKIIK
ncbi:MAG: putative tellurite resistance protein B-like protein [Candidatus Azotimanducaceae bacterium]|jgi:uncharacterized tellurite resistance protein B-like protein